MCNQYTNEHTFIYDSGNTTAKPYDGLPCQCKRLTFAEASQLALKALLENETRRQKEREQEAAYWKL